MDSSTEVLLLFASGLVLLSLLLVPLSNRTGAPVLLLVLVAGMVVGEDGPGGVHFDDFSLALAFGSVALAIILFAGGLETRLDDLKGSVAPAMMLASVGVVLTAAGVGLAAVVHLDVPLEIGMLLGAVVGSTDAAATFLLIRQQDVGLPKRLESTLTLESGINDPSAIFLTVALTGIVNAGDAITAGSLAAFVPLLVVQLGVGAGAGYLGGRILTALFEALHLPSGLYPAMAIAGALLIFAATALLGGSGFLAVFLAGVVIRARLRRGLVNILHFAEASQWLSQMALFLMLGLLVTPSDLIVQLPGALAIAAMLMFVVRPLAVMLSIWWLGFTLREQLYIGWVGLRGAVPIFLAMLPVVTPGPITTQFFDVVFVIVVASLVVQGWTIARAARWLGLVATRGASGTRGA